MVEAGARTTLFVLDIRLPDMSGFELAGLVMQRRSAVPVLLISGWPAEYHGALAPDSPWTFLPTPFDSDQLLGAVRQLLH
jgi:DNA-binding NtrC family response regulator